MTGIVRRALDLFRVGRGMLAVRRARNDDERARAKAVLAGLFADARGVTMKLGQMFSEIGGDTPFDALAKGVEPYPLSHMLPVLETGLGRPWGQVFRNISETGVAASLGQVHRAVLMDGREVAVKIRYPGIRDAVASELRLAGLLPGIGPAKKWGIDIDGYRRAIRDDLDHELDYRGEAERQMQFARDAAAVPGLVVPEIVPELCSDAVLVQSWEAGEYLDAVLDWPEKDRIRIAGIILSTLFRSLFVTGRVHGDPHMGNTFYRRDANGEVEMVLLDYGCVLDVSARQRSALLQLILACRDGGTVPAFECLVDMGFDATKLGYIRGEVGESARLLLKPFTVDAPFRAGEWGLKAGFEQLLGERRWWLRSAGPPESLLTVRVLHGALDQLESLKVGISWWGALQTALGPAMLAEATKAMERRRREIMQGDDDTGEERPAIARELRVLVTEGPRMVVSMAMPGGAAYDLPEIMPADVIDFIRSTDQIDLDEVMHRIDETDAAPQVLFEMDRGKRHYKVWLV